jgi:hypothetical protein
MTLEEEDACISSAILERDRSVPHRPARNGCSTHLSFYLEIFTNLLRGVLPCMAAAIDTELESAPACCSSVYYTSDRGLEFSVGVT